MQQFYIVLVSLGWMVLGHPFFISLTEIRQNPDSERLEISIKVFWDDLEVALTSHHGESIDFLNPEDSDALRDQIEAYFRTNFELWVAADSQTYSFLGYELDDDSAWFYLETQPLTQNGIIRVKNTLLIESFAGQQNIIHLYPKNSRSPRSLLLGKGQESGEFDWD